MNNRIEEAIASALNIDLIQIVFSASSQKEKCQKIKIRPVLVKDTLQYQSSEYIDTKVFHKNFTVDEVIPYIKTWINDEFYFGQIVIETKNEMITVLTNKKGTVTIKKKAKKENKKNISLSHNRNKHYILEEGQPVPFLVDLGVMTKEGKIVHSKYDKYRQINRFLEFVEDILPELPKDRKVTILDFGCGKSYLTFAMYYYLKVLKGYDLQIVGLDLKKDVIKHCNELAVKYGYDGIKFLVGDIASYEGVNTVDMVVTLHACDTATDYALYKAIQWNAKVILSVPCCQHELNRQMKSTPIGLLFKHGLIKERSAALITDALRGELLEQMGYKTQILEFIDMAHTPKNILIRAVKQERAYKKIEPKNKQEMSYTELIKFLGVEPTLHKLLKDYREKTEKE